MSEFEEKGDKLSKRSLFNPFPDTDSARDNYIMAANTFKKEQKWGDAARCFLKSAAILQKNDERLSASKDYVEAGQCLIKIDDSNYSKCYLSAIELYERSGYFGQSGKLYRTIAETYLSQGDYKNAVQFYKKSVDSFSLDEYSKSNYSQVIITYAELISQYNESYYEAIKIFEDEAKKALANNLLQYGAKTILFKAGLLSLVSGDVVNGQVAFEKYVEMDSRFQHSREAQLLVGILESMNSKDVESFNKSVEGYEQIALISAWERHIINTIKRNSFKIASDGDVAVGDESLPAVGGEVDLM